MQPTSTQSVLRLMNSVRVGVGVLLLRNGLVLLGHRIGSHGANTWAPPGGHLEFGESIESCARREVAEETGLVLTSLAPAPWTNDLMERQRLHYVTCFVSSVAVNGEPEVLEPEKCAAWMWFKWSALPHPLFQPLATLYHSGYVPPTAE